MKVHFIAIGETPLLHLALALHKKGYWVTGSDSELSTSAESLLASEGLLPKELGWFEEKITSDTDVVVMGEQVELDNPELVKAQSLGTKVCSYAEFIFNHSKEKTRVVIAGVHGKNIIASMILYVMNYHNIEVDYWLETSSEVEHRAKLTQENDFMVIEGNESSASILDERPKFHIYKPNIALLSGIDGLDRVGETKEEDIKSFSTFIESITKGGILVYNEEDDKLNKVVEESENPIRRMPYGTPNHYVEGKIAYIETPEGDMPIETTEVHYLQYIMGAKWVCQNMGIDEMAFYEAIGSFKM